MHVRWADALVSETTQTPRARGCHRDSFRALDTNGGCDANRETHADEVVTYG